MYLFFFLIIWRKARGVLRVKTHSQSELFIINNKLRLMLIWKTPDVPTQKLSRIATQSIKIFRGAELRNDKMHIVAVYLLVSHIPRHLFFVVQFNL